MARLTKPFTICCLLGLLLCGSAFAEISVATIDMQDVFDAFYRTKRFEKELRTSADMEYLIKLENETESLKVQMQEVVSRDKSFTMSEEAKKENREEGRRLVAKIQERENDIRQIQRKVEKNKLDERREILAILTTTIEKFAQDNAIDLLLDSSGVTSNGIPPILYANAKMDVTQTIISQVNQGHEEEIKELNAAIEAADEARRAASKESPVKEGQ